ncbi:MAG: hypothetical protein ACRECD_13940 [Burkholderiaceae bacterium]
MKTAHRQASQAKRRWQADPSALSRVMNRLQPFSAPELVQLQTPVRVAFESLRSGRGEEDDFHTLAAVVNVALIRSEAIDPLCVETCERAQQALLRVLERRRRSGLWGFDGPALQDIPPAIELHEQLLALSTPLQMQRAMNETLRRMSAGQVHRLEQRT